MKCKQLFQNLVIHIYPCTIALIVLICIFLSKIKYATKGVIFFFNTSWKRFFLCNFKLKRRKKYILAFSVLLFFMQLFFVYNYYFYTNWDVAELIKFSDLYTHHQDISDYRWYFSIYPNNYK